MNAPEKKKPDACRQRALDEDRTGQGAIESKDTPQQSAKLVLMLSLIQSLQVLTNEYALETDNPAWGVVDAADLVDAAHDEIAFAMLDGGSHDSPRLSELAKMQCPYLPLMASMGAMPTLQRRASVPSA